MRSAMVALATAETKLLLRNKTVAVTATLVPLAMGSFLVTGIGGARTWALALSLQVLFVLAFSVYFTVTAAVTSRREDRYLKRLRSAEPSDPAILAGTLLPAVVLGVVQVLVLAAVSVISGAPIPDHLVLVAVAVLGGAAMCVIAGLVTSAYTSSSEQAQITVLPFFVALLGGAVWSSVSASTTPLALVLPGGAVAELIERSLVDGPWFGQVTAALPAIGMVLVWIVGPAVLARRVFRWEART